MAARYGDGDIDETYRQLGRASLVTGVVLGVALVVVVLVAAVASNPFSDFVACRGRPGQVPYPLEGSCKSFYDVAVPYLTVLFLLGGGVFGLTVRSFVGHRDVLSRSASGLVAGVLWIIGGVPFVGLFAFGVQSADTPLGFSGTRLVFAALPGIAALLVTAVPAIYYSISSGDRSYGY